MEIERILEWIRQPVAAGNIVKGIERGIGQIKDAEKPILKERLIRELSHMLQRYQGHLIEGERGRIRQMLQGDETLIAALIDYLETPYGGEMGRRNDIPGTANALFVVNGPEPFGCLHTVKATALRQEIRADLGGKGSGTIPVNPSADPLIPQSLSSANLAIQSLLTEHGLTPAGRGIYLTYDIPMEIGVITKAYEGCSIGVAGAAAILSAMMGQAVPSSFAFTGYVSINGAVQPVGGIPQKIEAAADKGITRVFMPASNLPDVPETYRQIVQGIGTLGEMVDQVFGLQGVAQFIRELNGLRVEAAIHEEVFERKAHGGAKVLISCIGDRDPYGAPHRETQQVSEGAVLTAFRKVMPRAVYLLATSQLMGSGEATADVLQAIAPPPECEIKLDELEVTDPTVYDDLVYEMGGKTRRFLKKIETTLGDEKGIEPYLVISSGTPQMQAVWIHLLNTEETFRGARILQVREPRFVPAGEERVREVSSILWRSGRP